MILPELMIYIKEIGGEKYVGYVLATFTFTAFLSRPFSGKLTDLVGRVPVMFFGALVAAVSSLLYIFVDEIAAFLGGISSIAIFLIIRLFHGMSTGFKPTGTSAFLADIVPAHRRGEALGWLGFAGSLGMAAGPSLGSWLHISFGYNTMFICSSVAALLSILVIFNMKESLPKEQKQKFKLQQLIVKWNDFYEPRVITPTLTFFFYATAFGTIYTLIPLRTQDLGLGDFRGIFFTIYVGATTVMRIVAGKVSDKKGREPVLIVGLILIIISLFVLGNVTQIPGLVLGALCFGFAHGIVGPTLSAWTTDLSLSEKRGRAFSTMFMGMEVGIGGGALLSSFIYKQFPEHFFYAFGFVITMNIVALLLVFRFRLRKSKKSAK